MFVLCGLLATLVGGGAYFFSVVREVERFLPDHEAVSSKGT